MDVLFYREREYYLVECKWEKDPIEAPIVRELSGKLANRWDVRGVIASMSGFSIGAVIQAQEYAGKHIILFFGPADID